ncbi:unnamed protein product [Ilex paraguariensis]|uniref:BHLH domain-containing protein n=1 Tax=Ilex paraguariensis TaxID=185542 RepID=A0ABC8UVS6_9AQUA
METTPLRQFLQSVCCNSPWNYAVFWKLQFQNQMVLTWEDGCCNIQRPRDSMESLIDNLCFKGADEVSSNWGSSILDGNLDQCSIGLALAEMSSVHYVFGEGIVGEVASKGNHRWILLDNKSAGELIPKCPDDWLLQFVAGIKTILLVPVVSHGVLQLGSLNTVAEDLAVVDCLINKFNSIQTVGHSASFTSAKKFPAQTSSLAMSILMDNLHESVAISMNGIKPEDLNSVDSVEPRNQLPTTNKLTPLCMVQDSCNIFEKYMPKIPYGGSENDGNVGVMGQPFVDKDANETVHESGSSVFSFPRHYKDANETVHENGSSVFSFPRHCELHKALGSAFQGHNNQELYISGKDTCISSSLISNGDPMHNNAPSYWEFGGSCVTQYDAEHLLESVVSTACSGSDDNSSKNLNSAKSSTTSSGQYAASSTVQCQTEGSALVEAVTVPWNLGTSAFLARGRTATTNPDPAASSYESTISALIEEEEHQKKGSGYLHPHKGSNLSNFSKRRARRGENKKPRPRDRQLIQDRVKELRELVPNGAKCSIDGLLDRTIKHMEFLRSVTDQAYKLRQSVHQEVSGQTNTKSPGIKAGGQNGRSWAFELGSEKQLCPIVVEDLEYPGHMLIEMLCNDHGRFLEIAEAIRGVDLTILEGAMETRSGSTWAHFVVEHEVNTTRLSCARLQENSIGKPSPRALKNMQYKRWQIPKQMKIRTHISRFRVQHSENRVSGPLTGFLLLGECKCCACKPVDMRGCRFITFLRPIRQVSIYYWGEVKVFLGPRRTNGIIPLEQDCVIET